MNDTYQQMSELLDKLLSDNEKEIKIAFIEKEILLEKIRNLYVRVSALETEEYTAPQQETIQPEATANPKREFTPAKTLEEDVDLFFDTEHESYKAAVEKELKEIAEEIEAKEQEQPVQQTAKSLNKESTPEPVDDVFENLEEPEEEIVINADIHDDANDLFNEPDIEITTSPEEKNFHEEDDILNFIPPKSTPAPEKPQPKSTPVEKKPAEVIPAPVAEKSPATPAPTPVKPEPPKETQNLIHKTQQRSLNDLFNEQREDHSISSQYQRAKVGDLTKAISINDKFIYIKELFHNRGEDFSASIRQLNECKTLEEAFDCLEKLKQKFFWDSKSDAYLSFCDLLRRKYS
ncbi:MAG: hypothetical protein PUB29_05205 [Bacteroidales bacterium]|nr:hypothetical protein [Bacteroidales bacterium]